jgi:hypothetical protein
VTDDDFWSLIDVLDGVADQESTGRLVDHLAACPSEDAEDFADRLDTALQNLDASRFIMLAVRDVSDPDDAEPIPLLGDALHHFLLAVIAAGRNAYELARTNPTSVTNRSWAPAEADQLLTVYERVTGLTRRGPDDKQHGWCQPLVFGGGAFPQAYPAAVHEIADTLNSRTDWRAWWAASGSTILEVVIDLCEEDTGTVRKGKKGTKADFRLPLARLRHRNAGTAATIATDDMARILGQVQRKLGLSPTPTVPTPTGAEPIGAAEKTRTARLADLRAKFPRR